MDKQKIVGMKLYLTRWLIGSVLYLISTSFAPHPLHLTVSEAHWKKASKSLEISVKLFYDDFEKSLTKQNNKPIYLCPDSNLSNAYEIEYYFNNHYVLTINGTERQPEFIGYECENELVYVYLEYKQIGKIKTLKLRNELLFDQFIDQTNLFHLHVPSGSKTLLNQIKMPISQIEISD